MKIAFANSDDVSQIEDWDKYVKLSEYCDPCVFFTNLFIFYVSCLYSIRKQLNSSTPVFLRVFVYSCRNLPSIDENGLMDPYVKVRYNGRKGKTKVIEETKNPCFYETITFDTEIPLDINLSPNIIIEVWDKNGLGQSNIPISSVRLNIADAQFAKSVTDNLGSHIILMKIKLCFTLRSINFYIFRNTQMV